MSYYESKDGVRIFYEFVNQDAKGPVLVFVHGWLVNWTCFKEEIKRFKDDGFPVLYLDLRGHGRSDNPDTWEGYSLEFMAKDIKGILKKEKIKKIYLIGHSMGGMVSMTFAVKYRRTVKKLILINTTPKNPLISPKFSYLQKHKEFAKRLFDFLSENADIREKYFPHLEIPDFSVMEKTPGPLIFLKALSNTSLRSCFAALGAMNDYDLSSKLKKIKAPTLIIASTKDQLFEPRIGMEMQKGIPDALLKFYRATHGVVIKNPEGIYREIKEFIQE